MRHLHHSHNNHIRNLDLSMGNLDPQVVNMENMVLEKRDPQVETKVSVVLVTASKTFAGPVAGYTTLIPSGYGINDGTLSAPTTAQPTSQPEPTTQAQSSSTKPRTSDQPTQQPQATSSLQSTAQPSSSTPLSSSPSAHLSSNTGLTRSASSTVTSPSTATVTPISSSAPESYSIAPSGTTAPESATTDNSSTAPVVSSSPSEVPKSSSGMSGGAKAGLAFGIIILVALIAGGVFFLYRRKRRQGDSQERLEDDEKTAAPVMAAASFPERAPSSRSVRTASTAPRLSLRPVTQFSPNLGAGAERKSFGNKLEMTSNPNAAAQQSRSMWERPGERNDVVENVNPFEDHAASAPALVAAAPVAAAAGAAAGTAAARNRRSSDVVPKPLSVKSNNSQTSLASSAGNSGHSDAPSNGSEFHLGTASTASSAIPAAVGAAAVPASLSAPSAPPSNVHRVQMEFKPSMEDELELRPGQLVRILHEYDDGWALCIRMDRSQQGVAPRTCLSKLPLKPRPAGPPSQQPGPRPTGPLPMRPPVGPSSMVPRPLTPTSGRNSPVNPFADGATPSSGRARSKSNAAPPQQSLSPSNEPAMPGQQSRRRSKSVTDLQPKVYQDPASFRMPFAHMSTSSLGSLGSISSVPSRKPVPGQSR
ncbi:MAG: hypothetical protein Q9157_007012 [Trypethelium eluteriae]